MDLYIDTSINGNLIELPFVEAKINQGLFSPCEISVSFSLRDSDKRTVINDSASKWLGADIETVIIDRENKNIKKTYKGVVVNINSDTNVICVNALSEDYILDIGNYFRAFTEKNLISIAKDIFKASNLSDVETNLSEDSLAFKFVQQYDESNRHFLKRIAAYDGCTFFHNGEKFYYLDLLKPSLKVTLGKEEVSDVEMDYNLRNTKIKGMPYDFVKHTEPSDSEILSTPFTPHTGSLPEIVHTKSSGLFSNYPYELYNQTVVSKDIFEKYLKKKQSLSAGDLVVYKGLVKNPLVCIGTSIECPGHDILDKEVVIVSLSASFIGNVFDGRFEALPVESRLEPKLHTYDIHRNIVEPAIVTDNVDTEKLGRVKIRYLWDKDGSSLCWARIAQAGAGMSDNGISYGTHFTPRIKDHVLVSCQHGDPSLPIILGALYHSEHSPDFQTENGTEEVLVVRTPGESTIRVLDKSGSEEIIVSMKDNTNLIRLELKQPKITIESINGTILLHSKDIEINADKKITMNAENIEINSTQNTKATIGKDLSFKVSGNSSEEVTNNKTLKCGKNIEEKAGTNMTLQAGSKAEIKSTAALNMSSSQIESKAAVTNVIKGGIVQIN